MFKGSPLFLGTVILFILGAYGGPSDPEPNPSDSWLELHEKFVNNTRANPGIPILFYGDSIMRAWTSNGGNGNDVFNQYYAPLGVTNYAIGGDKTENILWRILDRELEGLLAPKLVVLMIGTNNLGEYPVNSEIATGVATVVSTLRMLLPSTKILLLGILPRRGTGNFSRILEINLIISRLHDNTNNIFYLDMFGSFVEAWGVVPEHLFYDGLHLTVEGYAKWARIMNPLLYELIK